MSLNKLSNFKTADIMDETTASVDRSRETNKTYIISDPTKENDSSTRLTLQRRKTENKDTGKGEQSDTSNAENQMQAPQKRLTLKRRTRTGSIGKTPNSARAKPSYRGPSGAESRQSKILSEPNSRTPRASSVLRSGSVRESVFKTPARDASASRTNTVAQVSGRAPRFTQKLSAELTTKMDTSKSDGQSSTVSTPTRTTQFGKISVKKEVFERLAGKDANKTVPSKSKSLERHMTASQVTSAYGKPGASRPINKLPICSQNRMPTNTQRTMQATKSVTSSSSSHSGALRSRASAETTSVAESTSQGTELTQDSFKMENSAVTVAVRVRPFSSREQKENATQVIFMDNHETVVLHPDSKRFTFSFDFSFCSIDETDLNFASQQIVYEKLAKPLLERAFEGFNTCLFAYGQTGSGKSYTMMGFGEEVGVTPRFCEELFSRLPKDHSKEITCHLEMSYFEVYNEKIHDLLIVKDEQNQKRLPLRVREHPIHGPYVADLSTNVVSSYADIQGWLELGNKQRATAATGMNDKSSRSHSVFTLVLTQTKTELVEGEEHDHTITSRINLVDLAGSERCASAQTSGDRLREGASINKSLLTLGKVISALSEQAQARKKVFIPYRESVLTWLLKESLGGNSKTAMIATLSPAANHVEESLSTLRYAKQARMIINVAKVNEDTNAKLIRELKAEVDKLRAAQMSARGIEPEKMRLFQQEIVALKMQLTQQEREMAEVHRAWREKLEEAEKRKKEEAKELQRAGVTFKVDNRLPNLVNLNEDPQLSEMLLYMIREGQTKVGRLKSESAHDIQLSGALIADNHCVISNVNGTVSILPMENAKTFVNGNLVSESTVLHHGDRVILGGDHYFRFNHPTEVQSGKRVSCWSSAGDGHKDFEFAKNELLAAQRAKLEAEIEEARLKAKEEMLQGIQVAKDMAQKELISQKQLYEDRIKTLEKELEDESQRKRRQELDSQKVASKMEELKTAKSILEQEVSTHKKRLHMEAQATRQAMADHDIRHAKIIEALEAEKRKIAEEFAEIQRKRVLRTNHTPKSETLSVGSVPAASSAPPQWDAMKLSLMIEEANAISKKLRKHTIFSRHEVSEQGSGDGELQVQVQNTKLGISTFWSLEKFQSSLAAMRELDQGERASKDDDVFYDPNDEWEQDISASSTASSLSRRRSRSLLKGRRISGRLYEIRVHPIQSLNSPAPQSTVGLMGMKKPPSQLSSTSDSALPGISKDLIGQAVSRLRECHPGDESVADRLTSDLLSIHSAVKSISTLYHQLDDDSPDNLFVYNVEAQTQLVKGTLAMERAVSTTLIWLSSIKPCNGALFLAAEELKTEVKKTGGYFQLLIQGCDSEITSMVTEAHSKMGQCLSAALRATGHLSVLTGTEMHVVELGSDAVGKCPPLESLVDGTSRGVRGLLEEGLNISKEMLREAQLMYPKNQNLQSLKTKSLDAAQALQSYLYCNISGQESSDRARDESSDVARCLCEMRTSAVSLFELNQALQQLHSSLSLSLRGKADDGSIVAVQSSSRVIDDIISGLPRRAGPGTGGTMGLQLPCVQSIMVARDDVHAALRSLASGMKSGRARSRGSAGSVGSRRSSEECNTTVGSNSSHASLPPRNRTVPKIVYSVTGPESASKDARWV
ncbi:kinesin-like protein KIF14 isoform X3 [Sardina pilchardus]|uniref:kinesin-like protein KIF14 isoform X3 n=1 Tax=Sardina pilchardus TaxID=27697 RepID=UPI002E151E9D